MNHPFFIERIKRLISQGFREGIILDTEKKKFYWHIENDDIIVQRVQ